VASASQADIVREILYEIVFTTIRSDPYEIIISLIQEALSACSRYLLVLVEDRIQLFTLELLHLLQDLTC
jgi:hypothetical protein